MFPHVIPPLHIPAHEPHDDSVLAEITLRDFLLHQDGFHLGLAPAFFGFYAYFGALTAWEEHVPTGDNQSCLDSQILSVAGASAGAMSAVLLAAGIPPRRAAEFCQSVKLSTFADPPGIGAAFKGDLFEELMQKFMEQEKPGHSLQLQDGKIPVAVSAFDIKTMKERLLKNGSMAKAARSSATFPLLFQPCQWSDKNNNNTAWFIDGGVTDMCGLNGLSVSHPHHTKRIVNLVVGGFPPGGAPGPSKMPSGITASEVLSISIRNTPQCGPWAMQNGPRAHEAARRAMIAALDLPLYKGKEAGHYELHLDAGCFVDK
jgi:predicted acylesterase/phospholipase RssA